MKKLAAWATDAKTIILLIVLVLATITKGVSWAMDVEKTVKKSAELQGKIVAMQEQMAASEEKTKKFIMDLWRIDPEVVNKWSALPNKPDSADEFAPWYEFEVGGLLRYGVAINLRHYTEDVSILDGVDSVRVLYVDTIYWHGKDSL